ncbi:unnamed protein product [Polarella glacialis]|uniref:CHK kinase-like domain-containing protein n=1 Tax=Polarella glacialis TaxID=89957 RepID=A0A813HX72_POLGL|nr:unnamed protein product [Polarella glacialis]
MVSLGFLLAYTCLRDSLSLGLGLSQALLRVSWDSLLACLRGRHGELASCKIGDMLDLQVVSLLLRKPVARIEQTKDIRGGGVVGDAAIGTDRAWLLIHFVDGTRQSVFVKVPSSTLWLRVVLQWTGLYANEMHFYRKILTEVPKNICCPCHAAISDGSRFAIFLEDLTYENRNQLINMTETVSVVQAKAALRSLAKLHAHFWGKAYQYWGEEMRPPFKPVLMAATLAGLKNNFPALLRRETESLFCKYVWHAKAVRTYWDKHPRTLCHGDAHIGNVYFKPDGTAGFFDWQVVSCESPMRDVTYFLQMGIEPGLLAKEERGLIAFYLECLCEDMGLKGGKAELKELHDLDEDWAWFQYRTHTLYSLTAFIATCGAGNFVTSQQVVEEISTRIVSACERVDCEGALDSIIAGHY